MLICLVGGAVRDMLLGREVRDKDFLVLGATPGEFLKRFPQAFEVGKAFPVYLVDGEEYAFPRNSPCPSCCCTFGDNDLLNELSVDLAARDFTVNALALPLPDHPLVPSPASAWNMAVGLPNGLDDLRTRILRPASGDSLTIDPLRVFRAARFSATLPEFTIHDELKDAMRDVAAKGLLMDLAAERVGAELRKALNGPAPGNFLRLLAETDCLSPWFKEFEGAADIPGGPPEFHDSSVLEHTARVMDKLGGQELPCWMALCHDLGKTATPADNYPHHYAHDHLGEPLALHLGERLSLPTRHIKAGAAGARHHMTATAYPTLRPGTRVDLLTKLHASRITDELFEMVLADARDDWRAMARTDLDTILAVRLPSELQGLGEESGKHLRELRCMALCGKRQDK